MDGRFEKVDRWLEKVDRRFKELENKMDGRFKEVVECSENSTLRQGCRSSIYQTRHGPS